MSKRIYVIIHGHFYQPPRENPWTGKIGKEYGADPYRNWNEKIARECYTPNAFSRVLDPDGYVVDIVNNYQYLNFNFGPTLINWIREYLPHTYERIVEGDKISCTENHGFGNAIAQVYNHIIMPLANDRDRRTQIEWGLFDFIKHFGRRPDAMWMAETAVNTDVMELLIEYGMKYIVLSPYQAHSFRRLGSSDAAINVSDGSIDPTRPYRLMSHKSPGKYLDVFFYDGPISSAVSFDHLARNSGFVVGRIRDAASAKADGDVLINISTDGELYGHHEPFADMCLAHVFKQEAERNGLIVTNYASYLREHPPEFEVFLKDGEDGKGTSWSCFHGVARWERDCGCTTGGMPHWNQQWRTPLRQALNHLRDELAKVFEAEGAKLLKDVWAARNDYVRVIADRTEAVKKDFLKKHLIRPAADAETRTKVFSLLESQHCALLMFTSCGWFFSEISGIESVQLMKYASMAMAYVRRAFGVELEPGFLDILRRAKSNIRSFGTGADVYRRKVLPGIVSTQQFLANYVIESYILKNDKDRECFGYRFEQLNYQREDIDEEKVSIVKGRVKCFDTRGEGQETFEYLLAVHSYSDFRCYVYPAELAKKFAPEHHFNEKELKKKAGEHIYGLKDLVFEAAEKMVGRAVERRLGSLETAIRQIYSKNIEFLEGFYEIGIEVPEIVKCVASYVVGEDIRAALAKITDGYNLDAYQDLRRLFAYAAKYSLKVENPEVVEFFDRVIGEGIKKGETEQDPMLFGTVAYILDIADELGIKIRLDIFQNMVFSYLQKHHERFNAQPDKLGVDKKFKYFVQALNKLSERLNVRYRLPF